MEADIFSVLRASVHDGPGVRTVIYFKGCGLRCQWCHNPEGLEGAPQILFYPDRCIGCGRCARVCPFGEMGAYRTDRCLRCGKCADACPAEALVACGKRYDTEDLMDIILKDRPYYRRSGGGVTFSGGECLMQIKAVEALAGRCRAEGVSTLCETALFVPRESVGALAGLIDRFYVDLKHMNPLAHRRWTGADNALILDNIRYLTERHTGVTIRIPLIPGVNDGEDNLRGSARFIASCGVKAVELLRYNALAPGKYAPLGLDDARFAAWQAQTDAEMEEKRRFMASNLPDDVSVM